MYILLARICAVPDTSSIMMLGDLAHAAALSKRVGFLSAEDALHTLIVNRQVRLLRAEKSMTSVQAVEELTRRLTSKAEAAYIFSAADQPTLAKTSHVAPQQPKSHMLQKQLVEGEVVAASSRALVAGGVNGPTGFTGGAKQQQQFAVSTSIAPSVATSSPGASKVRRQHTRKNQPSSPAAASEMERAPSLKRPRSSAGIGGGGVNVTGAAAVLAAREVDHEGKESELALQMTSLAVQINEAMRAGDRDKITVLMRQRDQLRRGIQSSNAVAVTSSGVTTDGIVTNSPGVVGDTKRLRS